MAQPTDSTKFDLCGNSVTLDYDALRELAFVATRRCLQVLHDSLRPWGRIGKYPTALEAKWMLEAAQDLHTSSVALHYLHEGMNREEVKVVRAKVEEEVKDE